MYMRTYKITLSTLMLLTKLVVPAGAAYVFWIMMGQLLSVMIVDLVSVQVSISQYYKTTRLILGYYLATISGLLVGGKVYLYLRD